MIRFRWTMTAVIGFALTFPAWSENTGADSEQTQTPQTETAIEHQKGKKKLEPSPGRQVANGTGNVAGGAGKGAGDLAKGTGKGAADGSRNTSG